MTRVKGYTRKDGSYVKEHQDSRTTAHAASARSLEEWSTAFHGGYGEDAADTWRNIRDQVLHMSSSFKHFSERAADLARSRDRGDIERRIIQDFFPHLEAAGWPKKGSEKLFETLQATAHRVWRATTPKDDPMTKALFFKSVRAGDGKLSAATREEIGRVGSSTREDMPKDVFLDPGARKYPVKTNESGEWKYSPKLLLAAAREARMHGREDIARRADEIRSRESGDMAKSHVNAYTRKDGAYVAAHEDKRQRKPLPDNHDFGAMLGSMKDGERHHFSVHKYADEKFSVRRAGDRYHVETRSAFGPKRPENGYSKDEMEARLKANHGQGNANFKNERLVHEGSN